MRAIVVSGGILAIAGVFGLGVVVGRFVLKDDRPIASAPTNAITGPSGLDNPLGDPNAALSSDPSLNASPPAPAAPLPPALPPGATLPHNGTQAGLQTPSTAQKQIVPITARSESDAAMAASAVTTSCNIRVSKDAPIRSWTAKDRISAVALGDTCGTATVRILLEANDGTALYSVQAPVRDFGIRPGASADDVKDKIGRILPTDTVRAAAFPEWPANAASPTRSEFSRDDYEAIRASNAPVTCIKLPSTSQRCLASDPSSGQVKVFSRG